MSRLIHTLIWDVSEGLHRKNLVTELFLIRFFFLFLVGWVELLISVVLKSGPVACDICSVLQFKKGKSLLWVKHRSYWLPKNVYHRNAWQHGLCLKIFEEILWFVGYIEVRLSGLNVLFGFGFCTKIFCDRSVGKLSWYLKVRRGWTLISLRSLHFSLNKKPQAGNSSLNSGGVLVLNFS